MISIHAPTRGATVIRFREMYKVYDFNPRSYKRSDCICSASVQNVYYFNPRSYKRSDIPASHSVFSSTLFQSTLLQEERLGRIRRRMSYTLISIHAPTRGATTSHYNIPNTNKISIHAPTRGATYFLVVSNNDFQFQSTLLQEERPRIR